MLTVVWLDDYQDNYLTAMEQICLNIKNNNFPNGSVTKEGIIRFLRDSRGLANHIDVSKIYKFYIKNCYLDYFNLFAYSLNNYLMDEEVMHPALDFINSLI